MLDALPGECFRELGVRVVPIHGGASVQHVVDIQFLFECTDATIMELLDIVAADSARKIWAEARELAQVGNMDTAREKVLQWARNDPAIGKRNDDRVCLTEFMTAAMTADEHERVEVHGRAEPDLIYYRPTHPFVGGNSWAKIKSRHTDYTQGCEGAKKKPLPLGLGSSKPTRATHPRLRRSVRPRKEWIGITRRRILLNSGLLEEIHRVQFGRGQGESSLPGPRHRPLRPRARAYFLRSGPNSTSSAPL